MQEKILWGGWGCTWFGLVCTGVWLGKTAKNLLVFDLLRIALDFPEEKFTDWKLQVGEFPRGKLAGFPRGKVYRLEVTDWKISSGETAENP